MDIFIDFDGCISPKHFPLVLDQPPHPECVKAIRELYESGEHRVVIFSCRMNRGLFGNPGPVQDKIEKEMLDYLHEHGIPYHRWERSKPHYHIIVDDRGYRASTAEHWGSLVDFVKEEAQPHTLSNDDVSWAELYSRFEE